MKKSWESKSKDKLWENYQKFIRKLLEGLEKVMLKFRDIHERVMRKP